tara:strand:+ start:185 stop:517 length:333 start_codon:yes stop_codon:yes gene_type:complete
MSFDHHLNTVSRYHYGHLPHEAPLMENILAIIDVESKLNKLVNTYNNTSSFKRYTAMVKAWIEILDTEDITTPHELRTSHTVEVLIYMINMYECSKAREKAKRKLNKHKK